MLAVNEADIGDLQSKPGCTFQAAGFFRHGNYSFQNLAPSGDDEAVGHDGLNQS